MENSGESGDDGGPLGPTAFLSGSGVSASYISVQSDDMEGRLILFCFAVTFNVNKKFYHLYNVHTVIVWDFLSVCCFPVLISNFAVIEKQLIITYK